MGTSECIQGQCGEKWRVLVLIWLRDTSQDERNYLFQQVYLSRTCTGCKCVLFKYGIMRRDLQHTRQQLLPSELKVQPGLEEIQNTLRPFAREKKKMDEQTYQWIQDLQGHKEEN